MSIRQIQSVLVATDLSPASDAVIRQAADVSGRFSADLHVIHVVEGPRPRGRTKAASSESTRDAGILVAAQLQRCAPDVAPASTEVRVGVPHACIAERRREVSADLVVIGPHAGKGIRTRILGTTADRVLRETDVPCLVVRRVAPLPWHRIGVPTDLSAPAGQALLVAMWWAARVGPAPDSPSAPDATGAAVSVVHVAWSIERGDVGREEQLEALLQSSAAAAVAAAGGAQVTTELLWANEPVGMLLQLARRRRMDLLVVPTSGQGALHRAILGSTSSSLARRAPCSVLLVPPEADPEPRMPGLDRLVIGTDFSSSSETAAAWAVKHFAPEAEHVLVHAIDVMHPPAFLDRGAATREELVTAASSRAEQRMRELTSRLGLQQPRVELREGQAHDVINDVVREYAADIVIAGEHTHPRGISRVLGTTAERLIRSNLAPVLLVVGAPPGPPVRVLAAVDASSWADPVLSWAGFLAERFRAGLAVCHVLSPAFLGRAQMVSGIAASRQIEERYREQGESWLRSQLAGRADVLEHAELLVPIGSAGFEILAAQARLGVDLIVMGSRGESALARGMLGSVASTVLRGASCPVLVVR